METNKLLKGALAVLICLFGTYVVLFPPNSSGTASTDGSDTINAILDTNSVCMDFNKYNPSTLSTGLINDMVSIYRQNQLNSIQTSSANAVSDDAYAILFDLDTIKKFIYHIEKGVQKNGSSKSKLGLRLYYAAYPDTTKWSQPGYEDLAGFLKDPLTRKYEKRHTLVMIPTIENSDKKVIDFNPFVKSTYETGIVNPKRTTKIRNENGQSVNVVQANISDPTPAMALTPTMDMSGSSSDKTSARNHGGIFPPGDLVDMSF